MKNTDTPPIRLNAAIVLAIAATIALALFSFGLSYPLEFRVRGDAYVYLSIAKQFESFQSVLAYSGDRTVGLPFYEFFVRKVLALITRNNNSSLWVDAVCVSMLIVHLAAAWFFSLWARRTHLIHSAHVALLLFAFLATYPALIGHTTTPLTDTLAIDLVLFAVVSLETALSESRLGRALLFSGISAFFFGFSILVRPGNYVGVVVSLVIAGALSLLGERRKRILIGVTLLGCVALLAPFLVNCHQRYGSVCLQSPGTVNAVTGAQMGLRGARTLWFKGYLRPGEIPTLPDDTLVDNYYSRCRLTSIIGFDDTSLTGCLLSRPLALPAYTAKKWIGLFDHFRFTPYLEQLTPLWLRWLSRAYDSLSWIGLALFFLSLLRGARRAARQKMMKSLSGNMTPVLLVVYSMVMLATHTFFHVEDRYGFPVIPLCATVLVMVGEHVATNHRSYGWKKIGSLALYCIIAWGLFLAQIVSWDRTTFY